MEPNIASSNIEEFLQKLLDKVTDEVRLMYEMLSSEKDMDNPMLAYSRVEKIKSEVEEDKFKLGDYVIRVGPSLLQKELYIDMMKEVETMAQNIDAATYRLSTLLSRGFRIDEMSMMLVKRILEKLIASNTQLMQALTILSTNPKLSQNYCKIVKNIEEEVDDLYRQFELKLFENKDSNMIYLMLMKDVGDRLEDSVDLSRSIADAINYLSSQKI